MMGCTNSLNKGPTGTSSSTTPFIEKRRSLYFDKFIKLPKTIIKHYLPKVGHGIMVLNPTIYDTSKMELTFKWNT